MTAETLIATTYTFWKEFDLDAKRTEFDKQAAKITENKEASVPARTQLVEETKKFGKALSEDQAKALRPIIRRYQQEVDRLTARANDAETAFLSLYKVLATVMDPVPALNQALSLQSKAQRATQLELENAKLAKELDNIRKESLEIQNQEVTVRRLQDTIAHYESHLMSLVNEKVAQHTQTLRAEYQRTLDTHIEREKELSAALAKAEEQRALTQQLLDQTQQQLLHLTRRHQEVQRKGHHTSTRQQPTHTQHTFSQASDLIPRKLVKLNFYYLATKLDYFRCTNQENGPLSTC